MTDKGWGRQSVVTSKGIFSEHTGRNCAGSRRSPHKATMGTHVVLQCCHTEWLSNTSLPHSWNVGHAVSSWDPLDRMRSVPLPKCLLKSGVFYGSLAQPADLCLTLTCCVCRNLSTGNPHMKNQTFWVASPLWAPWDLIFLSLSMLQMTSAITLSPNEVMSTCELGGGVIPHTTDTSDFHFMFCMSHPEGYTSRLSS